jgi:hypothetical protein
VCSPNAGVSQRFMVSVILVFLVNGQCHKDMGLSSRD